MPTEVFFAAYKAVTQGRFHPYVLNGQAQYFHANRHLPGEMSSMGLLLYI